jgi:hypothetical protein
MQYEKTVFKELREKVTALEGKLLEQRKNLEFVLSAKGRKWRKRKLPCGWPSGNFKRKEGDREGTEGS